MIAFSAALIAFLAAGPVQSGPMDHTQPAQSMRMYDAANEVKIAATIDSITEVSEGMMAGIHLTIRTGDETRDALLGPEKFLADKGFTFVRGETVEITGSTMTMGGMTTLIVREVEKNGKTLTLRDKDGTAVWEPKPADDMAGCCDHMKHKH